jgi:hypothetical protein
MVHKSNKWSMSKERVEECVHVNIIEILKDADDNKMLLSDLIVLLNQQTKHIKLTNHKKNKQMSVYLKSVYGSVSNFIDTYSFYEVVHTLEDAITVKLIDTGLTKESLNKSIINEYKEWSIVKEWPLVNMDDFELI